MPAPLPKLLGLWRGDDLSDGYASQQLAYEICCRLPRALCKRPGELTLDDLRTQLYPHGDEPPPDVLAMISKAYNRWKKVK